MTDKDRVEEVRKGIKSIIRRKCVSCGAVANLPTDDKDWSTDLDVKFILSLKDKEGKPMLGTISDDQNAPNMANEVLFEPFEILRNEHPEAFAAGCHTYKNAMLASNFRRVIIEEEKDENMD